MTLERFIEERKLDSQQNSILRIGAYELKFTDMGLRISDRTTGGELLQMYIRLEDITDVSWAKDVKEKDGKYFCTENTIWIEVSDHTELMFAGTDYDEGDMR